MMAYHPTPSSSGMSPSNATSSMDRFCALKALSVLDHTFLPSKCSKEDVRTFIMQAMSFQPYPYCFCVYSEYIHYIKNELSKEIPALSSIKLACVVNFPHGQKPIEEVVAETKKAISDGADEIDIVFNYRLFIDDYEAGRKYNYELIERTKEVIGKRLLKVILETGDLSKTDLIENAAKLTIEAGGDYLKTSTGKTSVSATPEAVSTLVQVIKDYNAKKRDHKRPIGLKVSGGVKTLEDAAKYMCIYSDALGVEQIQPCLFRFGASSMWKTLIKVLFGVDETSEITTSLCSTNY